MFNIKEEDNTPVTTVKLELIKKINSLTEEIEDNEKSIQRLKDEIKNSGFTKTESFFIEKKGIISTTLGVITFFAVPIAKIPFALAAAGASFSLPFFYEEEKKKGKLNLDKKWYTKEKTIKRLLETKKTIEKYMEDSKTNAIISNALKATLNESEREDFHTIFDYEDAPPELFLFQYYKGDKDEIKRCANYIRSLKNHKQISFNKQDSLTSSEFNALIRQAKYYFNEPLTNELIAAERKRERERIQREWEKEEKELNKKWDSMEKENSSYVFPTPITPNVPTQTTHNISSEDDGNITFGPHNEDERIKKVISDSHKETIYDSLKRGDTYPSYQFGEINEPKVNQEQNPSYTPPLGLYDEDVSTKEVRLITDNGIIELSPPVENANDANVINMEDYIKSHRTR